MIHPCPSLTELGGNGGAKPSKEEHALFVSCLYINTDGLLLRFRVVYPIVASDSVCFDFISFCSISSYKITLLLL